MSQKELIEEINHLKIENERLNKENRNLKTLLRKIVMQLKYS